MSGGGGFTGAGGTLAVAVSWPWLQCRRRRCSAVAGSAGGGGVSAVAGSAGVAVSLPRAARWRPHRGRGWCSAAGGAASGGMGAVVEAPRRKRAAAPAQHTPAALSALSVGWPFQHYFSGAAATATGALGPEACGAGSRTRRACGRSEIALPFPHARASPSPNYGTGRSQARYLQHVSAIGALAGSRIGPLKETYVGSEPLLVWNGQNFLLASLDTSGYAVILYRVSAAGVQLDTQPVRFGEQQTLEPAGRRERPGNGRCR